MFHDDTVNKCNNIVYMKPIYVTSDSYAEYNEGSNVIKPKFKAGNHVRIWKYKSIFAKGHTKNWSQEFFVVCKIKGTIQGTFVISDLNGGIIDGSFYEKESQKTNKKEYRVEKVIKRKGDKLYFKC